LTPSLFQLRRDALIREIQHAFAGVTRDGGVSLHQANVIDHYGSHEQEVAARERDTERSWQEVPNADIGSNYSALSFLDPVGLRYYLPAYMVWILRHFHQTDSASVAATLSTLNPSGDLREWSLERFQLLTRDQSAAVGAFLTFMVEYSAGWVDADVARQALGGYWGRF
jgi:hypothetical protein